MTPSTSLVVGTYEWVTQRSVTRKGLEPRHCPLHTSGAQRAYYAHSEEEATEYTILRDPGLVQPLSHPSHGPVPFLVTQMHALLHFTYQWLQPDLLTPTEILEREPVWTVF